MLGNDRNCLVEGFAEFVALTDKDLQLLQGLLGDIQRLGPEQQFHRAGSASDLLHVVKSGWVYTSRTLANGATQIVDIKLPGDFVGINAIALEQYRVDAHALTDCQVCSFSRAQLGHHFRHGDNLAEAIFLITTRQQVRLIDRLVSVGRRDALCGLACFLLSLALRLERIGVDIETAYDLPLKHRHLADAMGLTPVHVSRVLARLRNDGIFELNRGRARILDRGALQRLAERDRSIERPRDCHPEFRGL